MSVTISGLDSFDALAERVRASCETAVRETVSQIRSQAKATVGALPQATGASATALAGDIRRDGERTIGRVYLGTVRHRRYTWPEDSMFGPWIEYGTKYRRKTPFLMSAADVERLNFPVRLQQAVERATHGA